MDAPDDEEATPMKTVSPVCTQPRSAVPARVSSTRIASRGLKAVLAIAATAALASPRVAAPPDRPPVIPSAAVAEHTGSARMAYEGVVEAIRQTVVAA